MLPRGIVFGLSAPPFWLLLGILWDPKEFPKKERELKAETTEICSEMELCRDSFLDLLGFFRGSDGPLWLRLGPEAPPRWPQGSKMTQNDPENQPKSAEKVPLPANRPQAGGVQVGGPAEWMPLPDSLFSVCRWVGDRCGLHKGMVCVPVHP